MILPDCEIKKLLESGRLVVDPIVDPDVQIQSAGIDLRLGNEFRVFKITGTPYIDTKNTQGSYTEKIEIERIEMMEKLATATKEAITRTGLTLLTVFFAYSADAAGMELPLLSTVKTFFINISFPVGFIIFPVIFSVFVSDCLNP